MRGFRFLSAINSGCKIIIAAFSNMLLCTQKKHPKATRWWLHIPAVCGDTVHSPQQNSCSRLQTRKISTEIYPYQENTLDSNRNRWFQNLFSLRHTENTQTSVGYFPVAATGNMVSWCPYQPGEGSKGLIRKET